MNTLSSLSDAGCFVQWAVSSELVDYDTALAAMETRAGAIANNSASELVWLLEHPPLYTAGTSAKQEDLLQTDRFPVYWTGRGGQFTYHGPGQRVVYVMLDIKRRTDGDVRRFVKLLESWVIGALAEFGVHGETRADRVGVWVPMDERSPASEAKIAAIGIRVRKWVSFHGLSLNVAPQLDHFDGIVPCGISEHGVTSLTDLGVQAPMAEVDATLPLTLWSAFDRMKNGAVLPAYFEQRYIELVRGCMKEGTGFGVAWIASGPEVAHPGVGQPNLGEVGCYARIVDWDSLPNGLLGITIEGGERFRLHAARSESNQLVMGEVSMEDIGPAEPMREEWDSMLDVLKSLEQHPHVQRLGLQPDHADAWQVGAVLAQLLPVDERIKYQLLQIDDIEDFMERMDSLLNQLGGVEA